MDASIITVGDELLAGDVVNTNATWLAARLTERGVAVREILTIHDDVAAIAERVREASDAYDGVVVTGGLGGTPDDVTMAGIAAAFGLPLAVDEDAYADVSSTLEEIRATRRPDLELDLEAEASLPEGSRPLLNEVGISPGCVLENVHALPGIPNEMEAMWGQISDRFEGHLFSRTLRTDEPESHIAGLLGEVGETFDVSVGCYPNLDGGPKRIKLTTGDEGRLDEAYRYLETRL